MCGVIFFCLVGGQADVRDRAAQLFQYIRDALHRTERQPDYDHVHLLLATIAHEFGDRASNRDVRMDRGNAAEAQTVIVNTCNVKCGEESSTSSSRLPIAQIIQASRNILRARHAQRHVPTLGIVSEIWSVASSAINGKRRDRRVLLRGVIAVATMVATGAVAPGKAVRHGDNARGKRPKATARRQRWAHDGQGG
jgi:hypothetical protein